MLVRKKNMLVFFSSLEMGNLSRDESFHFCIWIPTHTHAAIHLGRKDHRTTGHVLLSPFYHCSALLAINHCEGILDSWGIALNVLSWFDWMYSLFQGHMLKLSTPMWFRWGLWEVIRFPWGHKTVTYIMGLMPSWEEEPSPCEETEGRPCLQAKKLVD
jgi:hypothetical protein